MRNALFYWPSVTRGDNDKRVNVGRVHFRAVNFSSRSRILRSRQDIPEQMGGQIQIRRLEFALGRNVDRLCRAIAKNKENDRYAAEQDLRLILKRQDGATAFRAPPSS